MPELSVNIHSFRKRMQERMKQQEISRARSMSDLFLSKSLPVGNNFERIASIELQMSPSDSDEEILSSELINTSKLSIDGDSAEFDLEDQKTDLDTELEPETETETDLETDSSSTATTSISEPFHHVSIPIKCRRSRKETLYGRSVFDNFAPSSPGKRIRKTEKPLVCPGSPAKLRKWKQRDLEWKQDLQTTKDLFDKPKTQVEEFFIPPVKQEKKKHFSLRKSMDDLPEFAFDLFYADEDVFIPASKLSERKWKSRTTKFSSPEDIKLYYKLLSLK